MNESGYSFDTTSKSGVWTIEGFVPHLVINGIRLPVKIDWNKKTPKGCPPKKRGGCFVFALPGGKEYISDIRKI